MDLNNLKSEAEKILSSDVLQNSSTIIPLSTLIPA